MKKEDLKDRIKALLARKRKKTEGKPNIEGVSKPKKLSAKKEKKQEKKPHRPASVSVGAHGGRYIQEPSGHKRYIQEGGLAGRRKFNKSDLAKEMVASFIKSEIHAFVQNYRKEKSRGK